MAYTEAELKSKTVKELKEIAKDLDVPAKAKKEELIAAILAAAEDVVVDDAGDAGEDGDDAAAGLEDAGDDLAGEVTGESAGPEADAAAQGKHASIVFNLEGKQAATEKRANIVGVKALSDAERAQLRAAKFGLTAKGGVTKPAGGKPGAAAAGGKAAAATGGVAPAGPVGVEEEIKRLQRAEKFGKASEADKKKLEQLQKKLEAQKTKQQLALDKVELMDPDKMAAREKKFGKPLLTASTGKSLKDPELLKKRAEKFGKIVAPSSTTEDEARKKARLERFKKGE